MCRKRNEIKRINGEQPKCLLELEENYSLLKYQINSLKSYLNIKEEDIFVIGGYKISEVYRFKEEENLDFNIINNQKWSEYNNNYSFYLIREYLENKEPFILLNGDLLASPDIFKSFNIILNDEFSYLAIDKFKTLKEEEMKIFIKDNRIIKLGKDLNPNAADGEYIGLLKLVYDDYSVLFNKMGELIDIEPYKTMWYEIFLNFIEHNVRAFYIPHSLWIEIDDKIDYNKALEIWRKIRDYL